MRCIIEIVHKNWFLKIKEEEAIMTLSSSSFNNIDIYARDNLKGIIKCEEFFFLSSSRGHFFWVGRGFVGWDEGELNTKYLLICFFL